MDKENLLTLVKAYQWSLPCSRARGGGAAETPEHREMHHEIYVRSEAKRKKYNELRERLVASPYDNAEEFKRELDAVNEENGQAAWEAAQREKADYDVKEVFTAGRLFSEPGVRPGGECLVRFRSHSWEERTKMIKACFPEEGDLKILTEPCSCGAKIIGEDFGRMLICIGCLGTWSQMVDMQFRERTLAKALFNGDAVRALKEAPVPKFDPDMERLRVQAWVDEGKRKLLLSPFDLMT